MWKILVEKLKNGETVQFNPRGNSMSGKIESGQTITVKSFDNYNVDDIVFCKVKGRFYVHLIKAKKENQYQICNNRGFINGWTTSIFGKVIKIGE